MCVGKQLALSEARFMIAKVVLDYEIGLEDGFNEKKWRSEVKEYQTLSVPAMNLTFKRR